MPRIRIDHFEHRDEAASALVSLRQVGMKPEDVGSLWLTPEPTSGGGQPSELPGDLYEASLIDMGAVQMSGWIAEAAMTALSQSRGINFAALFENAGADAADQDRVRRTLVSGGGIIGVKARDAITGEETAI